MNAARTISTRIGLDAEGRSRYSPRSRRHVQVARAAIVQDFLAEWTRGRGARRSRDELEVEIGATVSDQFGRSRCVAALVHRVRSSPESENAPDSARCIVALRTFAWMSGGRPPPSRLLDSIYLAPDHVVCVDVVLRDVKAVREHGAAEWPHSANHLVAELPVALGGDPMPSPRELESYRAAISAAADRLARS